MLMSSNWKEMLATPLKQWVSRYHSEIEKIATCHSDPERREWEESTEILRRPERIRDSSE